MIMNGVGRFVKQPELKEVNSTHVCEFSLAVNEYRNTGTERKVVHFLDFVIWDKAAEVITKYCNKGDMIFVSATPRQDRWESDGRNHSRVVFRVNQFTLLPNKGNEADADSGDDGDEESPF